MIDIRCIHLLWEPISYKPGWSCLVFIGLCLESWIYICFGLLRFVMCDGRPHELPSLAWRGHVAPDLSYRQALATFGLPTLKERKERLARDFFVKTVRNPEHKLRHLLPHERTIKYGLPTAKLYQNRITIQPELRRPLFPRGLPTGYEPRVYSCLVASCGGAI